MSTCAPAIRRRGLQHLPTPTRCCGADRIGCGPERRKHESHPGRGYLTEGLIDSEEGQRNPGYVSEAWYVACGVVTENVRALFSLYAGLGHLEHRCSELFGVVSGAFESFDQGSSIENRKGEDKGDGCSRQTYGDGEPLF